MHPCLELPPHLGRSDQAIELPKRRSLLRRLLGRLNP
jgi:hypothetical protein